jgi:hypothetical protein
LFLFLAVPGSAATRYVNLNSPAPAAPYTDWASAATNIQDAIDAALPGDDILVTNGVYATGGRVVDTVGTTTNRVAVTKPITLRSVNGPEETVIQGYKVPGAENGVGQAAVRCVYLANGASLVGFTLTNGATPSPEQFSDVDFIGGGVLCESASATVSDCCIIGNTASDDGGGAHGGTLIRCTITDNVALGDGGGADRGILINCLITKNQANRGGGVDDSTLRGCIVADNQATEAGGGTLQSTLYNCTVTGNSARRNAGVASKGFNGEAAYNCIIYGNKAALAPNYGEDNKSKVLLHHCCTTPLPSFGEGHIDSDPLLLSANRVAAASPCIGAGAATYASGVDIDGEPWRNPPSMGADEVMAGTATGAISVSLEAEFTSVAPAYVSVFNVALEGFVTSNYWALGDGTVLANRQEVEHAWAAPGNYPVTVTAFNDSHPAGVSATVLVQVVNAPVHYVNLVNATPSFPFTSWPTAATNIQDAIGAGAVAGRRVVVTDGVYDTGGTVVFGSLSNRIALTNGVLVESVNGPYVTVIRGARDAATNGFGDAAIRCAYVGNGSRLEGFTLTGGSTRAAGDRSREQGGGGAWCEQRGVLVNCVVITNQAAVDGGGVHGGTVHGCRIDGNFAQDDGGGADSSTLFNCGLSGNNSGDGGGATDECTLHGCVLILNSASTGGGADDCTLQTCSVSANRAGIGGGVSECIVDRCELTSNYSSSSGGGALFGILRNSTLLQNEARNSGGGSYLSTLQNCTVVRNRVLGSSSFDSGGGVYVGTVDNCIVYYNHAQSSPNYVLPTFGSLAMNHTCTEPLPPGGTGNITNEPSFVDLADGELNLQSNSPCINAGRNAFAPAGPDLDGLPRIAGGTVDIGAYEFQTPASTLSYAWLLQYGLPLDGSADTTDPDGDHFDNFHEWRAGTDPTNALSLLRLLPPAPLGPDLTVSWQSVPGRSYVLEGTMDLGLGAPVGPLTPALSPAAGAREKNVATARFTVLATGLPALSGTNTTTFTHTNGAVPGPWFYRVGVEE